MTRNPPKLYRGFEIERIQIETLRGRKVWVWVWEREHAYQTLRDAKRAIDDHLSPPPPELKRMLSL